MTTTDNAKVAGNPARLGRLEELVLKENLDGLLITKAVNRRYFSGFTGTSGMLFFTGEGRYLLTDFRYIEQAQSQAPGFTVVRHGDPAYSSLTDICSRDGVARVGFESASISYFEYTKLKEALPDAELVPIATDIDALRMVKDEQEIGYIKKACSIASDALGHLLEEIGSEIESGTTEKRLAAMLEIKMRERCGERPAFDTIVASGARSSLPHGVASDKTISTGDIITIDFGSVVEGYHSDMTRSIIVGRADGRQRDIYNLVKDAQLAAIENIKPGKSCSEVDAVARDIITKAGYGEYFGHGLGHGVGLEIHEMPRLSPKCDIILEPGMVVSVEPGVYIPEWGGIRIEDLVVVDSDGCRILTEFTKDLIEI